VNHHTSFLLFSVTGKRHEHQVPGVLRRPVCGRTRVSA
jgi:hypothetical protein